jgi:O-acetyl-ADP-ribose deacetylase (regulator of RNase III)
LWKECSKLGGCPTGEARISKGYNLPNRYVIHTVGPVYRNSPDDPLLLASCYRSSLELAERNGIKTISFPALSTGIFGYPAGDAAKVALSTIIDYLKKSTVITLVRMVLYDEASLRVHEEVLKDLTGGK